MGLAAILLGLTTCLSASGGDVANALAQQVPFPAADGFVVEARMNRSPAPRHPYGLSLVSEGDGPVLAVGETADGLDVTVTAVAGGTSETLARKCVALPEGEDLSRLPCGIGFDARRQVVWFSVGADGRRLRVEFAAPKGVRGERYRVVPSQVPSLIMVSTGKGK